MVANSAVSNGSVAISSKQIVSDVPAATPVSIAMNSLSTAHHFISTKLTSRNFLLWRTQIVPFLRGQNLMGFVDGSMPCPSLVVLSASGDPSSPNPAYALWVQQDQAIMSMLISSLSEEVMHLAVGRQTSKEIWDAVEEALASSSRVQSLWQGNASVTDYLGCSQSHVPKRRIIKRKDGNTASLFQKGEIYAFGPLYEEIIKPEPEVPGEANIGAEQDVLRASQRQRIKPAAEVAWEYLIKRTSLDKDLMTEIRGDEITDQDVTEPKQSNQNVTEQAQSNQNTTEGDQNVMQEENIIKEYYFSKIGEVIEEAMSAYDDKDMPNRDGMQEISFFKYMMINHGCLFLLQMFFYLGLGVDKLETEGGLHEILFGSDKNDYENRKSKFSKGMVFPGNQIPLVVLNKLIHHSFFKKLALNEDWKNPPSSDLLKTVLYDLILDPVLKMNRSSSSTYSDPSKEYTDVLHGLHCRWVGTARGEIVDEETRHQNGNVDLEIGVNTNYLDPKDGEGQRIPSATTMYSKGIDFKPVSGMAIREIQIKDGVFMGKVLHLPVFTFNEMMKEMYTSLKAYENDQGLRERGVSEYLRFLCDIVRTDQDAALLEQKGVIKVEGGKVLIDEVAVYLKSVACTGAGAGGGASTDTLLLPLTSTHLRKVKLDIIQYHLKPWYSKLVTRALLLSFFSLLVSILSATFSILSYFLQRKRHHH
ncbi:PREDICTED: uncharacterized protein LOC109176010 [Ipomoea nil]|uniref:uncharacterized protein LOC109176010 n=1 Tax=Ipomoea nil TaxID=35883 RepID=UPI000901A9B1|nr:PREDICTED: uncharacterized protein LOC109176010 [Ipomoea nil]XP_019180957.1 PREDICTED: uncharacterized protein LOC109176010 [Ipomoea nil]